MPTGSSDHVTYGDDEDGAYGDNFDDPEFNPDQTKVQAPLMFNDDLTKHEKLFGNNAPVNELPAETMPEDLPVEDIIEIKDDEPAVQEAGPEIIELNISPETLTAANESGTLSFGVEADKPAATPAPVTDPDMVTAPSFDKPEDTSAKDKKQSKEEKRKKKDEKKSKKNNFFSGNDIDMFPEDGDS